MSWGQVGLDFLYVSCESEVERTDHLGPQYLAIGAAHGAIANTACVFLHTGYGYLRFYHGIENLI